MKRILPIILVLLPGLGAYSQTLSGSSTLCKGSSSQYTVSGTPSATSYTWYVSPSTSFSSQGSVATATFTSSGTFSIYVTVTGAIAGGAAITLTKTVYVSEPPATPSSISGPSIMCPGSTATYTSSASGSPSATWYTTYASFVTAQTASSATVSVPANATQASFVLNVFGFGSVCGLSPTVSKTITIGSGGQVPPAMGSISGAAQVCLGGQDVVYTVPAAPNVTGYIWSVPPGATIASGQNTASIAVNYAPAAVSGNVGVYAINCNGSGPITSLAITAKPLPLAAGTITGTPVICPGDQNVAYSVPSVTGATGYVWSVPPGATIIAGQNTTGITVNYPASAVNSNVGVYGTNCNGNGAPSAFAVTTRPVPAAAGTIIGKPEVCKYGGRGTYSIPPIANATSYTWTPPSGGGGIISGQNTPTIDVYFTDAPPGNITVAGTNCGGIKGQASSLTLSFVKPETGGANISYGVDNVTGRLGAQLPLASVHGGDVQIPVVLSYTGGGVRVTDSDGWLGQNWSLSVQSLGIFREMRSLPDDYSSSDPADTRKGWLFGTARGPINTFNPLLGLDTDPATCSDEVGNFNFLNGIDYTQDTEPDAFHVSVSGLSFDFYFDENRAIHVMPLQDVVVTAYTAAGVFSPATTAGPITYFTVLDAGGVTYEFREAEMLTEKMSAINKNYFIRRSNLHSKPCTFATSWRLTRVASPVYGEINLTYNTVTVTNSNLVANPYTNGDNFLPKYIYLYPLVTTNPYFAIISNLAYSRNPVFKVLNKITSPTTELEFVSGGTLSDRLDYINVYDKRAGAAKLLNSINFFYGDVNGHIFLTGVDTRIPNDCSNISYSFLYNNSPSLPAYGTTDKDDWGFYKVKDNTYVYNETAVAGTLQRINQANKGYAVFFYETHDFLQDGNTVTGGGIRTRKILSYDGVSSSNNTVQEFEYKTTGGQTSGKLQYISGLSFSVPRVNMRTGIAGVPTDVWYYEQPPTVPFGDIFRLTASENLASPSLLNGSVVAYERVTVKTKDAGYTVYEYDLPASAGDVTANNGEWAPSKVLIARLPITGTTKCFAPPKITEGYNQFPFPVNPNYDFARGLLKKQADYTESGIKVRDVMYTYQRLYALGTPAIRKIYGLSLEELPQPGNGGKMFLYSRYEIFTDVKTVLAWQAETIYNTANLAQNTNVVTNYFYESANHRELTRVETQNSDGSLSRSRLTYSKDYSIASPVGTPAIAVAALNTAHRNLVIESLASKISNNIEKYTGGSLALYQTLGGKVYPDKSYAFVSNDGTPATGFTPASVSGGSFQYDQGNYVLGKTCIGFDDYGNITATVDRGKNRGGVAYGYLGTLPILQVSNAAIGEVAYSDFETTSKNSFGISGYAPTYTTGRTGETSKGLSLPAGSPNTKMLVGVLTNNNTQAYILSCWIKSPAAGTLSLQLNNLVTPASSVFQNAYTASTGYTYYRFTIPMGSLIGANQAFTVFISVGTDVQVDDIALYPAHADIATSTYTFPNGKTSDTDSRGNSYFYENDLWGRPLLVYDRNRNIIKKYNYQSR